MSKMDYQLKQLRSSRLGRALLAVESLEPRTLLASLCAPPTSMMSAPQETLSAPAAEMGSIRGGDRGLETTVAAPPASSAPPETPHAGNPPIAQPLADSENLQPEQAPPPATAPGTPPSDLEPEKPTAPVDTSGTDADRWENEEQLPETGNDLQSEEFSPACPAHQAPAPKPAEPQGPFANSPVRSGTPSASPFVSLFATASPASSDNLPVSLEALRSNTLEEFHYFETNVSASQSAQGLDSEPLVNVASRATFVALWLISKADLEDLQGRQKTISTATAAAPVTSSRLVVAHQPMRNETAADIQPTDIVEQALAAIADADEALRQADAACAVALNKTVEPTATTKPGLALALVNATASSNLPSSKQAVESQPSSPRWQLGLCSLVSILFSFRQPTESSNKSTAIRKKLLRTIQRGT